MCLNGSYFLLIIQTAFCSFHWWRSSMVSWQGLAGEKCWCRMQSFPTTPVPSPAPVLSAAHSRGTSGTEQTGTIPELWFYNLLEPRDFRDWKCIKINLPTSFFSLVFNWRPRRVSQTDSSDKFHHHIKMKRKMAGFQLQSKSFPKNCWVPSKKNKTGKIIEVTNGWIRNICRKMFVCAHFPILNQCISLYCLALFAEIHSESP